MRGALLITCITVACAHQARPPPVAGWEEFRSDHFRLRTDLPPAAARVTLGRLETLRTALLHAGGWPREVHEITPLDRAALQPRSERDMDSWEVHLCLADLWAMAAGTKGGSGRARNVRTELEAAAKEAPGEVVPQVRLASLERDPAKRSARAQELVARFPGSPEALVFRARVLRDDGGPAEERRAAALAAIAAAPDSVDALTAHAIEELRAENSASALVSVSHAAELEPWNSSVFVVRSLVLGAIGRCDEAAIEAQRAIDVLPDDPAYADLRALIEERERLTGACKPSKRP